MVLLLPRYSGGFCFLVQPPAGDFLSDQKVTKESVRGGGFRFPPPPTPPPLKRPKKGACGPPPLDSSPGCSTILLRCSVLTSSRTKHSAPLTLFVLALNSLYYFQPVIAPPLPHFRTDSTQIHPVENDSPKGGMWTSRANETITKFCKGDIRPRGRTVRPKC